MNNILLYSRKKSSEPVGEQTCTLLCEQLQMLGLHVEVTHSLNLPRLILNSYQTVHLIVEDLPLNVNEIFHLAICKALGKSTVLSVLNSDRKVNRRLFDFIRPDAFSVSQTNHLKLYRHMTGNKFIFSGFPSTGTAARKSVFKHQAFMLPLQQRLEEALQYKLAGTVYFDGRKLLKKQNSSHLRKKWNDLIAAKKISSDFHLVLSETKLNQLIADENLSVIVADSLIPHSEFVNWLSRCMNRNNVMIINEYQATGFSNYWTSGRNCHVLSGHNWINELQYLENPADLQCSTYKPAELFDSAVNELSRLYSKLWHQKASLLTSGSVKL